MSDSRQRLWAWACVGALAPLLLHSLGAPLGEPVAEDFDFLRSAVLQGRHAFFGDGGSASFWRPLAYQGYYSVLGSTVLEHPRWIAAFHALLLAASAGLLYRVFRRVWPAPLAAAAATWPLLMESARALITWPSHISDLGLLFFSVLVVHEAAFARLWTALLALLACVMCKEVGVLMAALIPFVPQVDPKSAGDAAPPRANPGTNLRRVAFALVATAAVIGAWGITYLVVRRRIGLTLPNQIDVDPAVSAVPWLARLGWSVASSLRALMSLPAIPGASEPYFVAALALMFGAAGVLLLGREARARLRRSAPWIALGLAWFVAFVVIQVTIYPIRGPYRSVFGGVGLGIAAVAVLGAARPALVAALVAVRLVAFALSPGPPARISNLPPETGTFVDFERVVRLQHLMADTRIALRARFPTLPKHARVGQHHMPRSALYAFGGDAALQLWYRDSTLSWMSFGDFTRAPETPLATIVEYQPHRAPQIALVEPGAMRELLAGLAAYRLGARDSTLAAFDRADALQRDRTASVFLSTLEAKRALCLLDLGRRSEAEAQARIALREWPANFDSRYVLASLAADAGRLAEAEAQLDTLLATNPDDAGARELLQRIRGARVSPGAPH